MTSSVLHLVARTSGRAVALAALSSVAFAGSAVASDYGVPSDERASMEDLPSSAKEIVFRIQSYKPALDSGLKDGARPYEQVFGSGGMWGARLELAKTWPRTFGTPGLGLGVGYFSASGNGLYRDQNGDWQTSRDRTALYVIPITAFAEYRLEEPLRRLGVPVAPYARAALERYAWITTTTDQGAKSGGTNGFSFTFGLALFADTFDRALAYELFREYGIRHMFLTVDATRALVDNFAAGGGFNLSTVGWSFGGGLGFTY